MTFSSLRRKIPERLLNLKCVCDLGIIDQRVLLYQSTVAKWNALIHQQEATSCRECVLLVIRTIHTSLNFSRSFFSTQTSLVSIPASCFAAAGVRFVVYVADHLWNLLWCGWLFLLCFYRVANPDAVGPHRVNKQMRFWTEARFITTIVMLILCSLTAACFDKRQYYSDVNLYGMLLADTSVFSYLSPCFGRNGRRQLFCAKVSDVACLAGVADAC